MQDENVNDEAGWPQAMATVTACKYDFGTGQALAFGVPTSKHFLISYNYWAPDADGNDVLHNGQFASAKAIPQGHLFPIRYNPHATHEHTHSISGTNVRGPLIGIGILGSVVLSLVWLVVMRGCR